VAPQVVHPGRVHDVDRAAGEGGAGAGDLDRGAGEVGDVDVPVRQVLEQQALADVGVAHQQHGLGGGLGGRKGEDSGAVVGLLEPGIESGEGHGYTVLE